MSHVPFVAPLRPVTFASEGEEALPELAWQCAGEPAGLRHLRHAPSRRERLRPRRARSGARAPGCGFLLTVGPEGDPGQFGEQPPNVRIARSSRKPRCSQLHGGRLHTPDRARCSRHWRAASPTSVLPQAADQFQNAEACVRAGAGFAFEPGEVTAPALRAAVERCSTSPGRERRPLGSAGRYLRCRIPTRWLKRLRHGSGAGGGCSRYAARPMPSLLPGSMAEAARFDMGELAGRVRGVAAGGAACASRSAVAVIERAKFPRDTLSTHFFQAQALASLKRLGVTEKLQASGSPCVGTIDLRIEDFAFQAPIPSCPATSVGSDLCVAWCSTRSSPRPPSRRAPRCAWGRR